MAKYHVNDALAGTQQAMATTYKTLQSVFCGGTPRRGKIYDLAIGTNGTPADNFLEYDISRMTVDGTGTATTPNAVDPADAAALASAKANYTVEPTVTAASSQFYVGINQRGSYRWVASPGGELVWPATAANGFVLRAKSAAYSGTATGAIWFEEQ